MRILFYILAAAAGIVWVALPLPAFEHLLVGDGLQATQLVIGVVGILLAVIWIKRARAAGS
jgi:uncharacterized membrane protein